MLSKESKIRVLENFYGLDYVFFGKPISKVESCCPLVKEDYISLKGALLSTFIEMLKQTEHSPKPLAEKVDTKKLQENAKLAARFARESARKVVVSEKSKNNLKESLKEELSRNKKADITKIVERAIREKAFSLAVDNLLVARILKESKIKRFDSFESRIIEDSYKILRDNLVESAMQILYDETD
jgi:hypothetical protein